MNRPWGLIGAMIVGNLGSALITGNWERAFDLAVSQCLAISLAHFLWPR